AKHDENYMSPEVKAAMDAAGASAENQRNYGGESNGT
ncbi:MAG TPA: cytochrome c biogenesis protein CcmE, partial [Gammaproteobacteria bacterium]|nr:cytochrome c biogenesis protein CcmE [Gammaproteobacteria bacterium]